LKLIQDLRSAGLAVDYSLTPAKSDKQFKRAQELKAVHTIKLERGPSGGLTAKIKILKRARKRHPIPRTQCTRCGAIMFDGLIRHGNAARRAGFD